jgi:predicted transcriptional regulator
MRVKPEYMKQRTRFLKDIASVLKVNLIMTSVDEKFISFHPDVDCGTALQKMGERIDHAPILEDGRLLGYVKREKLGNFPEKLCREVMENLDANDYVSLDTTIEKVLDLLSDKPFLLVTQEGSLLGIITRADLNKRAACILLYAALSELESALVDFIKSRFLKSEYLKDILSEDRAKEILYHYWIAKMGNTEVSIEQHLCLGDVVNIIQKSKNGRLLEALGYNSRGQSEELSSFVDLRNRVMHPERTLLSDENSVSDIRQKYRRILELVEKLENKDII